MASSSSIDIVIRSMRSPLSVVLGSTDRTRLQRQWALKPAFLQQGIVPEDVPSRSVDHDRTFEQDDRAWTEVEDHVEVVAT